MLSDDVRAVLSGEREWAVAVGDALETLRQLPDGVVSCCVSSPPYYGLRSYGTEPQVWGGDLTCEHDFEDLGTFEKGGKGQNKGLTSPAGSNRRLTSDAAQTLRRGGLCRCGAWRGELGQEPTPELFVEHLVSIFREVRRALHPSGSLWLNVGDSFHAGKTEGQARADHGFQPKQATNGSSGTIRRRRVPGVKPKDLLGIPHLLVFALRADGWYWRQTNHWCKNSCMPESVRDRTTSAVEYIFHLTKQGSYFYDQEAERPAALQPIGEPKLTGQHKADAGGFQRNGHDGSTLGTNQGHASRNLWNYWTDISASPIDEAHYATMPQDLARRCIRLGSSERGVCPACHAPWRRVLERSKVKRQRPNEYVKRTGSAGTGNNCGNTVAGVAVVSKGWEPSCACGLESVPALILDPFSGAGTTALVATQLGRRAIGIELNPSYAELSRRRICNASLVKDETLPGPPLPLFGG